METAQKQTSNLKLEEIDEDREFELRLIVTSIMQSVRQNKGQSNLSEEDIEQLSEDYKLVKQIGSNKLNFLRYDEKLCRILGHEEFERYFGRS